MNYGDVTSIVATDERSVCLFMLDATVEFSPEVLDSVLAGVINKRCG